MLIIQGGGYLATDFFFILSGFFLSAKCENKHDYTVNAAWQITKRKIYTLYPAYGISLILYFLLYIKLGNFNSIISVTDWFTDELYSVLLLSEVGIPNIGKFAGSIWYLSSLIINTYFIAWLLVKNRNTYIQFLAPLCCIIFYGYCGKIHGSLSVQELWIGPVYGALGRGFADMSIGVIVYEAAQKMNKTIIHTNKKIVFTIIEVIAVIMCFRIFGVGFSTQDFQIIFMFAYIIAVNYCHATFLSEMLNRTVFIFLGRLSYFIYLIHLIFSTLITVYAPNKPYINMLCLYLVFVM